MKVNVIKLQLCSTFVTVGKYFQLIIHHSQHTFTGYNQHKCIRREYLFMMMINRRMMMMLPRIDRYHSNIIITRDRIAVRKSSSYFIKHSSFYNHNNNKKIMMMMIGQVKRFSNKVLQQPHPIRSLQFDNIIELQHKIVEAYAANCI